MKEFSLKQRILKVATYEFLTTGIMPVTMDGLSRKLKISKRTLYETFNNKNELLCESFVMQHDLLRHYIQSLSDEKTSSLKVISLFFIYKTDEANYISPRFYSDLLRYPHVVRYLKERDKELKFERDAFLKKCIDDGYFRSDINYSIIGEMLSRQTMYLLTNSIPGADTSEALRSMMYVCIRGCCTPKGQEEFDYLIREHYRTIRPVTSEILRKRLEEL